jgi:hypothetical protein
MRKADFRAKPAVSFREKIVSNAFMTPDKIGPRIWKAKKGVKKTFPLPRGNSNYAVAKRAEYVKKDLTEAEFYYKLAISGGERTESAVKDLAGILHQTGRTDEACVLLEKHKDLFVFEQEKYQNLLISLQKQIVPSGNSLNKSLKISDLTKFSTAYI